MGARPAPRRGPGPARSKSCARLHTRLRSGLLSHPASARSSIRSPLSVRSAIPVAARPVTRSPVGTASRGAGCSSGGRSEDAQYDSLRSTQITELERRQRVRDADPGERELLHREESSCDARAHCSMRCRYTPTKGKSCHETAARMRQDRAFRARRRAHLRSGAGCGPTRGVHRRPVGTHQRSRPTGSRPVEGRKLTTAEPKRVRTRRALGQRPGRARRLVGRVENRPESVITCGPSPSSAPAGAAQHNLRGQPLAHSLASRTPNTWVGRELARRSKRARARLELAHALGHPRSGAGRARHRRGAGDALARPVDRECGWPQAGGKLFYL